MKDSVIPDMVLRENFLKDKFDKCNKFYLDVETGLGIEISKRMLISFHHYTKKYNSYNINYIYPFVREYDNKTMYRLIINFNKQGVIKEYESKEEALQFLNGYMNIFGNTLLPAERG